MDVRGLAAVVSGGGSGMGAASARALAAAGAKVALLDRNGDAAAAVAAEIGGLGLACDIADSAEVEAAVDRARAAHGPTRVLVNCAGVAAAKRVVGRDGPMPLDDFRKVIEINLIGTFDLTRHAAADMVAAEPLNDDGERGVIISTSSVAAFEGQLGQAAYAASKAGIVGLMLPLARELARSGVRVMTIAPGLIATPMLLTMPQEVQDNLARQVPFPKRFGTVEEFSGLVMHIIGNPMMSGDVIRLDGGMRMQ